MKKEQEVTDDKTGKHLDESEMESIQTVIDQVNEIKGIGETVINEISDMDEKSNEVNIDDVDGSGDKVIGGDQPDFSDSNLGLGNDVASQDIGDANLQEILEPIINITDLYTYFRYNFL